jgi:SAM-dependent methyltransferase
MVTERATNVHCSTRSSTLFLPEKSRSLTFAMQRNVASSDTSQVPESRVPRAVTSNSLSKKPKVAAADLAVVKKLRDVRKHRAPYVKQGKRLLAESLARFLPEADTPVVEIGAGDGQFREHLPERLLSRVTHTEPLAIAAREMRKRFPAARVVRAGAESLPFGRGEVGAVIASCVLDVVPDGSGVAREAARVLQPGGVFIHWLDMSTRLNDAFEVLNRADLVPLPNVFSDPSAARWPEDMFLASRADLTLVLEILDRHFHPFAKPLRQYLAVFAHLPHTLRPALAEYYQLQESAELRLALQGMFRAAAELAEPRLQDRVASFQGRPVASSRFFESRLKSYFDAQAGFEVVFSDIVADAELAPSDSQTAYLGSCVGEQRILPALPETRLVPNGPTPESGQMLRELGAFVFVAQRI